MKKSAGLIILLALAILLTGCGAIMQWALQAMRSTDARRTDYDALPTLPRAREGLIPLEILAGFTENSRPQISADGSLILYRHMDGVSDSVIALDWQTGERTNVRWPDGPEGVPGFTWAPDGRTVLFFMDNSGDENNGLYTSNIDTGATATLLLGGENDCYYVSDNPLNEKEIFLAVFNRAASVFDLYLFNYETGQRKLVMENPGDITGYHIDHDGELRLVTRTDALGGRRVWLKNTRRDTARFAESEWTQVFTWDYPDADTSGVLGFMPDNTRILYIDTRSSDTATLCTYDVETRQTAEIFNDPDYDLYGAWTDLELEEVTAVSVERETLEWQALDESFEDDYEALSAVGDVFDIVDSSQGDKYWIVMYISDVREADYYVYDMTAGETEFLFNARPSLDDYTFAPMEPFCYTAGDGLEIEGYVTFPPGTDSGDLPTVVMVHGGPWRRDSWGFNFETQLLANRGYAVIQVNFRGSSGYGKRFMSAGDREWGGLMHQDILDAVEYAVREGWTDAGRVGVYGASYGGYEALVCAAFSSDVFACAVDAFGPSSLITFVDSLPPQWSAERQSFLRALGDPETDAEFMRSRSPLYHADQISIPLLIAQGGNDVRVVRRESDQMVAALEAAGIPVSYLLFPGSGHGLNSYADMHRFYTTMEAFLAAHLSPANNAPPRFVKKSGEALRPPPFV